MDWLFEGVFKVPIFVDHKFNKSYKTISMAKIRNRKYTHVQSSIIHDRENVEVTQVSINR